MILQIVFQGINKYFFLTSFFLDFISEKYYVAFLRRRDVFLDGFSTEGLFHLSKWQPEA